MENLMAKEQAKVWEFESSSSSKIYQTIEYTDGYTSCNCPGWTRREKNGVRSCRHTNMVAMGTADSRCLAMKDFTKSTTPPVSQAVKPKKKTKKKLKIEKETPTAIVRKINW